VASARLFRRSRRGGGVQHCLDDKAPHIRLWYMTCFHRRAVAHAFGPAEFTIGPGGRHGCGISP